ncbi:hypothetical protein FIBSPDRAFT_879313 [Athelia psychrophila]|uniref:Uncharacterized protein n=1 Tax=Athelia psychrophila TaxID=1759441 RepID=A0A167U4D0_9AGAM|nr:hypothetical protein FIBSPDRAFT_879313 [Fibularhizoctonia sp. CBS 109695]
MIGRPIARAAGAVVVVLVAIAAAVAEDWTGVQREMMRSRREEVVRMNQILGKVSGHRLTFIFATGVEAEAGVTEPLDEGAFDIEGLPFT